MMSKYKFISVCLIAFIFSCIGSMVDALVGNICTSETLNQIKNVSTTGVTIKVSEKEWAPGSKISVGIDAGGNFIRNLVVWAETVDGEQPGTHVGYWSPMSGHEYVEGCNGPANSTISNQFDLNLAQTNYEWYAPSETAITPSPQPSQPSTSSSPQQSQPSTDSSPQPSQPSTDSSPQPSQPSTDSSPLPNQPSTPSGTSPTTTSTPTHKPKKPKHKHNKHHHKNHKNEHYEDFSDLKEFLIDAITGKQNRLTRRDQTSVGSIIFKGVLQFMNHPDDEIYSFTSNVIDKSTSLTSTPQNTTKNDTVLRVTEIDQNVPKDPPFSAAHSKFTLKSHTLISILTLIVGFLTY